MLATVTPISSRGSNDKRLVVYVSQEMYEELERRSKLVDRSVSNFTRNLIASALEVEIKE